jgi:hypothetical protein
MNEYHNYFLKLEKEKIKRFNLSAYNHLQKDDD